MNPRDLRFTITIDSNGVHSVPKMRHLEAQLQLLAQGFTKGDTPWQLIVNSDGQILERVGFDSDRLTIGQVVGGAVREFLRALDQRLFLMVDELVDAFALKLPEHYLQIDWDKAQFRFETIRSLESRGLSIMMLVGDTMVMPLPGAERGPYRDDVNDFVKSYFLEQLAAKMKAEIPHEAILLAEAFLDLQRRAERFGIVLPDMLALSAAIGENKDKAKAVPLDERTKEKAIELNTEYQARLAMFFGDQFPEFASATSAVIPELPLPDATKPASAPIATA